jgi:hypothetical protein
MTGEGPVTRRDREQKCSRSDLPIRDLQFKRGAFSVERN